VAGPAFVQIEVAMSDFQPSRDLQASIIEGHMQKLDGMSSIVKRWKRRYFILRQDSCLYYYKQKEVRNILPSGNKLLKKVREHP
jgi:hypothetical protein